MTKRRDTFAVVHVTLLHVSNIYCTRMVCVHIVYEGILGYFVSVIIATTTYSIVICSHCTIYYKTVVIHWLVYRRLFFSLIFFPIFFFSFCWKSVLLFVVLFCLCRWSVIYNGNARQEFSSILDRCSWCAERHFLTLLHNTHTHTRISSIGVNRELCHINGIVTATNFDQ